MSLSELASIQGLNELEWGERLEFLGVSSEAFDPATVIILPVDPQLHDVHHGHVSRRGG